MRAEIRRAAADRKTEAPAVAVPATARLRPAEQGLIWMLVHRPVEGLAAIARLEPSDLEGLLAAPVFALASSLSGPPYVQLATAAPAVAALVYVCGLAMSPTLPEPKGTALPE